jgi:hypothetical protein
MVGIPRRTGDSDGAAAMAHCTETERLAFEAPPPGADPLAEIHGGY